MARVPEADAEHDVNDTVVVLVWMGGELSLASFCSFCPICTISVFSARLRLHFGCGLNASALLRKALLIEICLKVTYKILTAGS